MKNFILSTFLIMNPYNSGQEFFEKNVKPIFEKNCSSCHASLPGQDWADYSTAVSSKNRINFRVFIIRDMPPESINKMTPKEKITLKSWVTK